MAETDYSQPFIGYRSAGRRPEAQNDRIASANAPLSALRGFVTGTLGIPGDVEGLVRMIPGLERSPSLSDLVAERRPAETVLPTSEYFRNVMPFRSLQETPAGRAFQELGGLGAGAGLGPATRMGVKGAGALGRLAAEGVARGVEGGHPLFAAAQPMYVVKPKGGNWLSGSAEGALKPLKREVSPTLAEDMARMGYPVDEADLARTQAMNSWIDKQLTRYLKNEMATPEDPLRALAARGVSHIPEQDLIEASGWIPEDVATARRRGGFPEEGMAEAAHAEAGYPQGLAEDATRRAAGWEALSDTALNVAPASEHTRPLSPTELRMGLGSTVDTNPWLMKVPPETPVYYPESQSISDVGFGHLTDELRNALNPASGLPPELLLKYSSLDKVSVPQAVERVAAINDWRAAQKAEADLARANNAATVTHKEYPESGFAWKQIKRPAQEAVDDETLVRLMKERDMSPEEIQTALADPNMKRVITEEALGSGDTGALADALKYEGDTMGHCVGGYCPDVESGKSQIFSLRDKKGEPHVTIEVRPPEGFAGMKTEEDFARLARQSQPEDVVQNMLESAREQGAFAPRIVQIKGKGNRAPKAEYLPMVQDFVKSGNWGKVGDLGNTNLRDISGWRAQAIDQGADPDKAAAFFGQLKSPYATQEELDTLMGPLGGNYTFKRLAQHINNQPLDLPPGPPVEGFAAGGYVEGGAVNAANQAPDYDETKISSIVAQLHKELNNG